MKKEREELQDQKEIIRQDEGQQTRKAGAFNEQNTNDLKSTRNVEEEAGLEQERKDAMTERD